MTAVMKKQKELTAVQNAESITQNESQQNSETSRCKPRKKSRTLKFSKWTGGAASAVAGVMSLGDFAGYIKADWGCILLLGVIVVMSFVFYRLRITTSEPVK